MDQIIKDKVINKITNIINEYSEIHGRLSEIDNQISILNRSRSLVETKLLETRDNEHKLKEEIMKEYNLSEDEYILIAQEFMTDLVTKK
jgi:hypothetical protein